jgi:Zn2+/Cd2+-exporting ATPase
VLVNEQSEKTRHIATAADNSIEQEAEKAHEHVHNPVSQHWIRNEWVGAIVSLTLLVTGLFFDYWLRPQWFDAPWRAIWYSIAYIPVGLPVLWKGIRLALRGEVFTEFILMSIATIGAFYIGEYPEGVTVMLFYSIGELLQGAAVNKAKRNIKALLDVRPDTANVYRNSTLTKMSPAKVKVDEIIQVRVGERVPLDGMIISEGSSFNTAALTGESKPSSLRKGETALAGMVNEANVVDLKVTRGFDDSSLARILTLVQSAQGRKAKTELFIRRFAKIYTPIVVLLAVALTFIPFFFVADYNFELWLYRALIFLVISCPCALVVAIPLGYFGGIGAGSRNGILFKGSSYLDTMTRIGTVVMDKTGTLTKGVFKIREVVGNGDEASWLSLAGAVEKQSTHPIARAVSEYVGADAGVATGVQEMKGMGVRGIVEGKRVVAGSANLLQKLNIAFDQRVTGMPDTVVLVAIDDRYAGHILIADEMREDSRHAVSEMHAMEIATVMLSGDKQSVVDRVAGELNIHRAFGDLLPEDKVEKLRLIQQETKQAVAFVGDGINDAPVLALSDVGIAMGGLGSDAAIETADVVIQTDQPSKIVTAIRIGKATNNIVWQNIAFAFGVKIVVMALGVWGIASMWGAVFADVGVALLAILNAVRIQRMKF